MRASLGLVAALLVLGCFDAGEPRLTAEDLAWSSEDLSAAEISPSGMAFVASVQGSIYRSVDAGQRFRRVHAEPAHPVRDLVFADDTTGWAASDRHVLVTRDGGETWAANALPAGEAPGVLRALAQVGPQHLVGVGTLGLRVRSQDGGRSWQDVSSTWQSADLFTLSCEAAEEEGAASRPPGSPASERISVCLAAGAFGGLAISRDRGATWQAAALAPPLNALELGLSEGAVEWAESERQELAEWAKQALAAPEAGLRIEAHVDASEIERFAKQSDPDALFDIIEARLRDTREVLEVSGLPSDRIETVGAPPFGYRDSLDDAPDLLSAYFEGREATSPGVTLSSVDLSSLVVANAEARVMAGPAGQLYTGTEALGRWARAGVLPRSERPIALFGCGDLLCWLNETGWMGVLATETGPAVTRRVGRASAGTSSVPATGAEPLRDFVWAKGGDWGLLVGDAGQLFRGSTSDSLRQDDSAAEPRQVRAGAAIIPPTGDAAHWMPIASAL